MERLVPLQRLKDEGQPLGIVAGSGDKIDTQIIRLALLTPTVRRHEGFGRHLAQPRDPFADAGRDDPRRNPGDPRDDPERRCGDGHVRAPHRVAGGHVDDLMTQDTGQLVLGIRQGQQPARDVDVPVGKGKGVRLRLVDDLKGVGDVLSGGLFGDPTPHRLHVGQERRIGDEPHARFDLAGLLGAQLALLLCRDHRHLRPTAHGIDGAPGDRRHKTDAPENHPAEREQPM